MREVFEEQLASVRRDLVAMSELVQNAVADATKALLEADAHVAESVISDDAKIDAMREVVEDRTFEIMSLQNPVASDLRMLISALKMVGELERMGDLAVHVAKVARLRVPDVAVPAALEPTLARMGSLAEVMVGKVSVIIDENDVEAARELEEIDEQMDKLRRKSFRELFKADWDQGVEAAVDIALLGRYYERIADHAVSIARRVVFLVTGEKAFDADPE